MSAVASAAAGVGVLLNASQFVFALPAAASFAALSTVLLWSGAHKKKTGKATVSARMSLFNLNVIAQCPDLTDRVFKPDIALINKHAQVPCPPSAPTNVSGRPCPAWRAGAG